MTRKVSIISLLSIIIIASLLLTSCGSLFGNKSDTTNFNDEMQKATGKWMLLDNKDTFFIFDGRENVMTFSYHEDGEQMYSGKFRAIRKAEKDASNPLSWILTRTDKENEDWISCFVEGFEESFTQFSIMEVEEDLGVTDGTVYTHIYRPSELPYKLGTYVLEGNEYKPYTKTGFDDGVYRIPEGTYKNESGQTFCVTPIMNRSYLLFSYTNDGKTVEGIFNIHTDKSTIYLYIEHDIYEKVKDADKDKYDTTFSLNYPPDFYLRGSFDTSDNSIVINDLYHHTESPTEIEDSFWVFGTYVRQE